LSLSRTNPKVDEDGDGDVDVVEVCDTGLLPAVPPSLDELQLLAARPGLTHCVMSRLSTTPTVEIEKYTVFQQLSRLFAPAHSRPMQTIALRGIELSYETRGTGEPCVLLHGFTGCGRDWRHAFDLDALSRRYELLIPDLRGHGGSTNPARSITHRECAEDVRALLDHLGIARCKAVGMSLGGNTLLHLATLDPLRIEAMVLVSATTHFPEGARAIMRMAAAATHDAAEWERMRASHVRGDDQIQALFDQYGVFAMDRTDIAFDASTLGTICARTLVVHGDRDPLYPIEIATELHRSIPNAQLFVVPNEGHGPIFGPRREAFERACLRFLEEKPATAALKA
jgi:pimeloyl-ACP methyl ester carboxylesterase